MKMHLYVNSQTGKKFKTTETGKKQLSAHVQLKKTCVYLGECDANGVLLNPGQEKVAAKTVTTIKEIMNKNKPNGGKQTKASAKADKK